MKKIFTSLCILLLLITLVPLPTAAEPTVTSPSVLLMEAHTGQVLFEQNSHEPLRPASVTKVMTILLAYEAIRDGKASLSDLVTVSENAAGYGGSTILLETGEQITLENLIKGMCIASGNDAAIATAEYIGGSVSGFVDMMNHRAEELGMADTHFVNPCGLDADGHATSAHDIALMSRELMNNFPEVTTYTTTWHEMMPHNWKNGPGETDMANTNKLIQSYEGMTGLKTGFTRLAKYSISATATRGDLSLIAVVMGAETRDDRSADVVSLLDYGFGSYSLLKMSTDGQEVTRIPVAGIPAELPVLIRGDLEVLTSKGASLSEKDITSTLSLPDAVAAPIAKGAELGEIIYSAGGEEVGRLPLVAGCDIERLTWSGAVWRLFCRMVGINE